MGIPQPGAGSVTEDTGVSGSGLLKSSDDVNYLFGSDIGQWTAQTLSGLYGRALSINSNGVWTYTATNMNAAIQALNTGNTLTEVFTVTSAAGTINITITINGQDEPPCFAAGTLIATSSGARPFEALNAGDVVLTRDSGPKVLRWVGQRVISCLNPEHKAFQPVRLRQNCFGPGVPECDVSVSPNNRILVSDPIVELISGQKVMFCAAQFLINGQTTLREPVGEISYHHLLLDKHEVLFSSGCQSESFYLGDIGLNSLEEGARAEVMGVLEELLSDGEAYGATARGVLKAHEAALLRQFYSPTETFLTRLTQEAD